MNHFNHHRNQPPRPTPLKDELAALGKLALFLAFILLLNLALNALGLY